MICAYNSQEFVRVGYYVNVDYEDEQLRLEPPENVIFEKLSRNILAEKPRVTRFPIKWDNMEMSPSNDEEVYDEQELESELANDAGNDSFVKDNLMELAY